MLRCNDCKVELDDACFRKGRRQCRFCEALYRSIPRHGPLPSNLDGAYLHRMLTPDCPRCSRPFHWGDQLRNPSLDHQDPDGGQSRANVWIICRQCNKAKGERPMWADQLLLQHPELAWCSYREHVLPRDAFYFNATRLGGVSGYCKECNLESRRGGPRKLPRQDPKNIQRRRYLAANPEVRERDRERARLAAIRYREANRASK